VYDLLQAHVVSFELLESAFQLQNVLALIIQGCLKGTNIGSLAGSGKDHNVTVRGIVTRCRTVGCQIWMMSHGLMADWGSAQVYRSVVVAWLWV
jgi:hypothetical protein